MVGTIYKMQPQPLDPANTHWLDAGVLRLGVEYREVDPVALAATYGEDAAAMAEMEAHAPEGGFTDEGVSIHVVSVEDGHEYLRFDVFDGDPHYHYVSPTGDHNQVVEFDAAANGDMLAWTVDRLTHRLAEMLALAGGGHLSDQLDVAVLGPVLDEVAAMAASARRAQAQRQAAGR